MMGIVTVGFTFVLLGGDLDLSVGSQMAVMNVVMAMMIRDLAMTRSCNSHWNCHDNSNRMV